MEETSLANYPALTYKDEQVSIEINCPGACEYTKMSYPVKYGLFSRLETQKFIFEFNLNHEIQHARSKSDSWSHPSEWLKRTMGNDWVYYSTGGYAGVVESIGEYYLPNLEYQTNSLLGGKPFETPEVARISGDWHTLLSEFEVNTPCLPAAAAQWLERVRQVLPEHLAQKADTLFGISGARATVLPPDARHSDYDIIPLTIQDGCLYKCRFCRVKNKKAFQARTRQNIRHQILELKALYGRDLVNYNAVFLGEHDALNAPMDLIVFAAQTAHDELGFANAYMQKPMLYFFGSVDALLNTDNQLFDRLNRLPFHTCINIGLESADDDTLALIGKPITAQKVRAAFEKMQMINQTFDRVEMTGNFVMDRELSDTHTRAMMELVRDRIRLARPKGSIYLSPLKFGSPSREVLFDFYHLKTQSRLPLFLYIIQRL
jgi:Radical SAM superfamily